MKTLLENHISGKKVLILGFGREGQSTYRLLRNYFPELPVIVADQNINLDVSKFRDDPALAFALGDDYLDQLENCEVIFKSPGISLNGIQADLSGKLLLSQTSVFLEQFRPQVIGITGTKGKSTTSSLIHHIFRSAGSDVVLVGNIGKPPFDLVGDINSNTIIVFELSSHQLEHTQFSPHVSVLLNIFQEHLDHYKTFEKYTLAKLNIAMFQDPDDFLIINASDNWLISFLEQKSLAGKKIKFSAIPDGVADLHVRDNQVIFHNGNLPGIDISRRTLKGIHNLNNILAAVAACSIKQLDNHDIEKGIATFVPLEHRLEEIGVFKGIRFVNDSISTIPESTIEALKTVENVNTLILGGMDRGIDYTFLVDYLANTSIENFIFVGSAGRRIHEGFLKQKKAFHKTFFIEDYDALGEIIFTNTRQGGTCLLSPAASSYDRFKNFEERGRFFKKIAGLP